MSLGESHLIYTEYVIKDEVVLDKMRSAVERGSQDVLNIAAYY